MAFLTEKEAAAAAGGDSHEAERLRRRRTSFHRDHLGRWGPAIADRVAREARHPLYKAAGSMLRAVLTAEGQ
jgi:TorA maturation chaperone TorD